MQTTTEQRIAAEIKLLQFVLHHMPLNGVISTRVYVGDDNLYYAQLFIKNSDVVYCLGNDINQTISVLETIRKDWS